MKVVLLCGGKGCRFGDEYTYTPKGMVKLGHKPILWHIMKRFSLFGHTDFILALGSKGELIRDYFINYKRNTEDLRITLGSDTCTSLSSHQEESWSITFIDTGETAQTGARIARCKKEIGDENFFIAYSDCVAMIDFSALYSFHQKQKKVLTVTGVVPPYREREFSVHNTLATKFYEPEKEPPGSARRYMNGGFMVASNKIFSYLTTFTECRLETDGFESLMKEKELAIYPHHAFWRWLDTNRDYEYLSSLVERNQMYWLTQDK